MPNDLVPDVVYCVIGPDPEGNFYSTQATYSFATGIDCHWDSCICNTHVSYREIADLRLKENGSDA